MLSYGIVLYRVLKKTTPDNCLIAAMNVLIAALYFFCRSRVLPEQFRKSLLLENLGTVNEYALLFACLPCYGEMTINFCYLLNRKAM